MRARQLVCGIWSLCFMFCLFCIFLHQTTAKRKLKFVSLVFRHGDHTPQEFFPTDKHKEIARQQGYGQLTKLGIQQQYELGQYMRRRYSHFLSVVYKQCEASTGSGQEDVFMIYVQSTDCDHTLMSAQASLAGLYPPTQSQIWNPRILWQPIPVHTVPLTHDNLLYLPFSHCPKHKELLRETFATGDFQKQFKHYKDINNYTLPVWATHGVRTKLIKLSELLLQAEFGFHKQIQKSRLQGGILLKTILKHILDARKPSYHQKMVMYSTHAATIAALQMALNVFNGKLPPHSACHFFELYQEKNGQMFRSESSGVVKGKFHASAIKVQPEQLLELQSFLSSSIRMAVIRLPNLSRILCFSFHIIVILLQQTTAARELKFVVVTGMQQLFELGQYMRKRYSGFLNSTYNRQETLNFPLPNCPRFDELQHETQTSKEFQNRIQPYMDFLQTMAVNTGLELNHLKILDNFQLWNTYDTLHCEGIHNYTLPVWATKDVINKMEKLAELSLLSLFGVYKTEEKSRLQGGVLVNIILNSIKQAVNSSAPRKMEVYSAHDTTIGAVQIALNIFNGKLPPYAACQFFELYQESNGQVSSYLCKSV
ncbi:hypothetical protein Nmel_000607 [Mimus melanotis]